MLAPCLSEFDISIIDRLSPIFNGSPFTSTNDNQMNETSCEKTLKNLFSMVLESPSIDIRLR